MKVSRFGFGVEGQPIYLVTLEDATERRMVEDRIERIYRAGAELTNLQRDVLMELTYEERLHWVEACVREHLQGLFHFDAVEIRRLDRSTGELVTLLAIGMTQEAQQRRLRPSLEGAGITGYVAATGHPYICHDTALDVRYLSGLPGARSSLTLPLLYESEVVGTFNVESRRPAAFTQEDARFLQMYCRELARALVMLELLETQRCLAQANQLEQIHSRIAEPVDDIYTELLRLNELLATDRSSSEPQVQETVRQILAQAAVLKNVVQRIGAELPPILAMAVPCQPSSPGMPSLQGVHLLVVAKDLQARSQIRHMLQRCGAIVSTVRTGRGGLLMLDHENFDLVLVELHLEDMESKQFLQEALDNKGFPNNRLILMTTYGYDPHHNLVYARQRQIGGVFLKEKICEQLIPTCCQVLQASPSQKATGSNPPSAQSP
jgi:GAF domain-containing protein/CheY-like chemotaxis protein